MEDLKQRLERIANTPRPSAPLDISEPIARGRRVRRIRRTSAVTGAVAAVGITVTFVFTGSPGSDGDESGLPDGGVATGQARPNPLIQSAAFGWLPSGYGVVGIGATNQPGPAPFFVSAGPPDARGIVSLRDLGPVPTPRPAYLRGGEKLAKRYTAPPVNGRPAYWMVKPGTAERGKLAWKYGPKNWALLEIQGPNDNPETFYKIATSATFNLGKPTAFPFSIKGVPPGFKVKGASIEFRAGRSFVNLGLVGKGEPMSSALTIMLLDARISGWLKGTGPASDMYGRLAPNTTIDGHPAHDSQLVIVRRIGDQTIVVQGVNGFDVSIRASGETFRQLQASGGVRGLFSRMTVLGTDPARWTTTPLRG